MLPDVSGSADSRPGGTSSAFSCRGISGLTRSQWRWQRLRNVVTSNCASRAGPRFADSSSRRRRRVGSVELDRATERIEAWLLDWLMTRLALTPADVSRDRPFAEYGVDSLTAVEMSHELEQQFSVPLPPIVAWNYPTPAALARFLAEETTGVRREAADVEGAAAHATNGAEAPPANDAELAALLAEVEKAASIRSATGARDAA